MTLTFTTTPHVSWDEQIKAGVRQELEVHTETPHIFDSHRIYALKENSLIGGAILEQQGDSLWIDSLWIDPQFRKQGIGNSLIHQIVLFAKQHHCQNVQLNTYFPAAKSFFLAHGFKEIACIPQWKFSLECCLMRKIL